MTNLPRLREDAVCATTDPELFYPQKGEMPKVRAAQQICRSCPAMVECREWAIAHGEDHGVWGGTTPRERLRIRRDRAATTATDAA
nr:WhiB family transcriptional regulator [Arsenicicoccus dermatophilus]